jgi:hypothetical protein
MTSRAAKKSTSTLNVLSSKLESVRECNLVQQDQDLDSFADCDDVIVQDTIVLDNL